MIRTDGARCAECRGLLAPDEATYCSLCGVHVSPRAEAARAAKAAPWRLVVVESPFAGAPMLPPGAGRLDIAARVELHREYLADCLADCLRRGEAPFASHGLYTAIGNTVVLDDDDPTDRAAGIAAGLAWGDLAAARIVYVDLGVSRGMLLGIARGRDLGQPIELRTLGGLGDRRWPQGLAPAGCTCADDDDDDAAVPFPCEPCQARIDR